MSYVKHHFHDEICAQQDGDDDMARYEHEMLVSPYLERPLRSLADVRTERLKNNVGELLSAAQRVERQLAEGALYHGEHPQIVIEILRRVAKAIEEHG